MGCPFVIPPHPVCGRGTKPRGRLRVGLSPIPDAEPLTFCCERRRGLASPDGGDALALTFAYPVAKRDRAEERRFEEGLARLKRVGRVNPRAGVVLARARSTQTAPPVPNSILRL
jgi:hypothetical protein